jgi:hypothetical protein
MGPSIGERFAALAIESSCLGWDGDHGQPVLAARWNDARAFLNAVKSALPHVPDPFVAPCGDGSAHLTWQHDGHRVLVEFAVVRPWLHRIPAVGEDVVEALYDHAHGIDALRELYATLPGWDGTGSPVR